MVKYSLPQPIPLPNPYSLFRGFNFIRPVKIENSGAALRDYQVKITLTRDNFPFEKCRPDGADIRFRDDSGEIVPYWIESWTATQAVIWCKMPYIPEDSHTYLWMVYGNPTASSLSDGYNVFEQFDIQDVVALWHLDESEWTGAADEVKDSVGSNHGVAYNGAYTVANGKFNRAGSFDGIDDYIFFPNYTDLNITDKVTIEAWAKSAVANQKDCIIVGTQSPNTGTDRHYFGFDNDGYLGIGVGAYAWSNEGNNYTLDTNWHFYTLVTDGTVHKIYVDGQYRGMKSGMSKPETYSWFIGANHYGPSYHSPFNGIVDEVCIYHRALTDAEILLHYNYYIDKMGLYINARKFSSPEPVVTV